MIDIRILRENPQFLKDALAKKKFSVDIDAIVEFDAKRRAIVSAAEEARAAQNAANSEMAKLPKGSDEFKAKLALLKESAAKSKSMEQEAAEADRVWKEMLLSIPNIPHESVPVGKSEKDNVTTDTWGDISKIENARPHWDIPFVEKALDFQRGVKVTGAGFPFYVGDMARLVRALLSLFLEEALR